jgi:hypothetical protein
MTHPHHVIEAVPSSRHRNLGGVKSRPIDHARQLCMILTKPPPLPAKPISRLMFTKAHATSVIIAVQTIFIACVSLASETEFLQWEKVSIKFADKNSIEVETDGISYKSFIIKAFGKEFSLALEDLEKLRRLPISSLSAFSEAGYEETGGYTMTLALNSSYFRRHGEAHRVAKIIVQESGYSIELSESEKTAGL